MSTNFMLYMTESGYFAYENKDLDFLMVVIIISIDYPAHKNLNDPELLMTSLIMTAHNQRIFNFTSDTVNYDGYPMLKYTYEAEGKLGLTLNEYTWFRCDPDHVINFVYIGLSNDMIAKKRFLEEFRNAIGTIRMSVDKFS